MTDQQLIYREALKAHVRANTFDTGRPCDTCKGEGRLYPGQRVIHTRRGGFGVDWDETAILDAIDNAQHVTWARGVFGPFLAVTLDTGELLAIEIPPMPDTTVPDPFRPTYWSHIKVGEQVQFSPEGPCANQIGTKAVDEGGSHVRRADGQRIYNPGPVRALGASSTTGSESK